MSEQLKTLHEHHRQMLLDSAISEEVIAERGYYTETVKANLAKAGFHRAQQRPPALMMPVFTPRGDHAFDLIRPDEPRMVRRRLAKYEFPRGLTMSADVPPRCRADVGDPGVPLYA